MGDNITTTNSIKVKDFALCYTDFKFNYIELHSNGSIFQDCKNSSTPVKDCGYIDTMHNHYCTKTNKICPVNSINITLEATYLDDNNDNMENNENNVNNDQVKQDNNANDNKVNNSNDDKAITDKTIINNTEQSSPSSLSNPSNPSNLINPINPINPTSSEVKNDSDDVDDRNDNIQIINLFISSKILMTDINLIKNISYEKLLEDYYKSHEQKVNNIVPNTTDSIIKLRKENKPLKIRRLTTPNPTSKDKDIKDKNVISINITDYFEINNYMGVNPKCIQPNVISFRILEKTERSFESYYFLVKFNGSNIIFKIILFLFLGLSCFLFFNLKNTKNLEFKKKFYKNLDDEKFYAKFGIIINVIITVFESLWIFLYLYMYITAQIISTFFDSMINNSCFDSELTNKIYDLRITISWEKSNSSIIIFIAFIKILMLLHNIKYLLVMNFRLNEKIYIQKIQDEMIPMVCLSPTKPIKRQKTGAVQIFEGNNLVSLN